MKYPVIAECDGEVELIPSEAEIAKVVEPYDIASGCCRFWDVEGFALKPSVRDCRVHTVIGCIKEVDQRNAEVSFERMDETRPDIEGLKDLLDRNLLMSQVARDIVNRLVQKGY